MGEPDAAVDEGLDRQVTIEVLGRRGRRRARRRPVLSTPASAARLNHPNVASIHEVGDGDGRRCIVMELRDGRRIVRPKSDLDATRSSECTVDAACGGSVSF